MRLDDLPQWTVLPTARRCQAATKEGYRHRMGATNDGLCYPCFGRADDATRARAKALAEATR